MGRLPPPRVASRRPPSSFETPRAKTREAPQDEGGSNEKCPRQCCYCINPVGCDTGPPSARFAGKTLLQRREPVERGLRQRAFLHGGERILELARRRPADQDGADRGMRDGKAGGGLGEARREALAHERREPAGAGDVG